MIPHIETSQLTGSYTMETFEVGQKNKQIKYGTTIKITIISDQCLHFIPPQNARKPKVLWCL